VCCPPRIIGWPITSLSPRIAGFSDAEIAELVQKGGGNAGLECQLYVAVPG
jgi:hypothetical protein